MEFKKCSLLVLPRKVNLKNYGGHIFEPWGLWRPREVRHGEGVAIKEDCFEPGSGLCGPQRVSKRLIVVRSLALQRDGVL